MVKKAYRNSSSSLWSVILMLTFSMYTSILYISLFIMFLKYPLFYLESAPDSVYLCYYLTVVSDLFAYYNFPPSVSDSVSSFSFSSLSSYSLSMLMSRTSMDTLMGLDRI